MKKMGISIAGISCLEKVIPSDDLRKKTVPRSYDRFLECFENCIQELVDPLKKEFLTKVYLTTYKSKYVSNVISSYKPDDHQILDIDNSHQILTFIKSLELLQDKDLDYIFCTRFDLKFSKGGLQELDMDWKKFNFFCREARKKSSTWSDFVNDCIYLFPVKFLSPLIEACWELYRDPPRKGLTDLHSLYNVLSPKINNNINFMYDGEHFSSNNKVYKLVR